MRAALFGKLNTLAYKSIESGHTFCKLRGNPYVELVHWVHQLLQLPESDFGRVVRHFGLDIAQVARDTTEALDRLPRGATSISDLSQDVETAVEQGWLYSTLMFGCSSVRTGTLLIGILKTRSLRSVLYGISGRFESIDVNVLTDSFATITGGSPEDMLSAHDGTSLLSQPPKQVRDIFICYRRQDSVHPAGRIFDRLVAEFGRDRIFKDVNSIPAGIKDFAEEIQQQLKSTKVMLAIVGNSWLSARDSTGRRRLDDKDDYVRIELKWGLDKKEVSVVPVLLDDVMMPDAASLPSALKRFVKCQAVRVRADPEFERDVQSLLVEVRGCLARSVALAESRGQASR
jgi:hypothetical protein